MDEDEIHIIKGESDHDLKTEIHKDHFRQIHRDFAEIGRALSQTYSENNLETGDDFIDSLAKIEQYLEQYRISDLASVGIGEEEKQGMIHMLEYLVGKLKRRLGYVSDNDVNY